VRHTVRGLPLPNCQAAALHGPAELGEVKFHDRLGTSGQDANGLAAARLHAITASRPDALARSKASRAAGAQPRTGLVAAPDQP
jgi:hypothetical protein